MAKRKDDDGQQPVLVPMSAEELQQAARRLARKIRELEEMRAGHAESKKEMRLDEEKLGGEISAIAETVGTQGR